MKRALSIVLILILCFTTCGAWAEDLYQAGKDAYEAKDYDKALQYYEQAADQGNAEGLRGIGTFYAEGDGVEKDINKAMEYWQRAADQGDTKALINLGRLYAMATEEGVPADFDKGLEYFQKAIDLGDAEGLTAIGTAYYNGKAVEQDYGKALEYWQRAAEQGSDHALVNIAYLYGHGEGVEQDFDKTMEYYQQAVDKGNEEAMAYIGNMYLFGDGVEQDYAKAFEWYQKAAEKNEPLALANLGWLYHSGSGVEQDYAKALEYYQKAADKGNTYALCNLGYMYAEGDGVDQDYAKALEYYQQAADKGTGNAFVGLGDLYSEGHGVEQDTEKAVEYYTKALEMGIDEAGERLNELEAGPDTSGAEQPGNKPATTYTAEANKAWYDRLDFSDETEKENALRGLIEAPESVIITRDDGVVAWNLDDFAFVRDAEAPDTVNPSLWRNTQLNAYAGLFEVCDGIYQVRGYDMANATFIRTDNGWVVFDVLMCKEDMAAAKALMEKHFGPIDVKGVLYSHSHIDHYGGIYGLISAEDAADASLPLDQQLASGKAVVLAPKGFLEHAVSENLYCGPAMGRRAQYQYGALMKPGETGRMAIGIGLGQSVGTVGLLAPTYEIATNETITIDGLEIQIQLTPGTEAPAEMNAWFPKYKGLWLAENCTGTMHNIYTLRGAQVRDAAAWAGYILEAESLFGDEVEVVFQSHNWPHWGNETIRQYMEDTAAVYQYINNQTLYCINQGMTAAEISRTLTLPDRLDKVWYCRQYYGTLSHNIKAVYQRYMGWYDANPVNLNPMTPEDTAKKWVEYLGDVDAVLEKARADFEKGEYQWVAQVTKELVYADPANQAARDLCADALEQLGYQAESGPWRSAYLMGAWELRDGNQADKEGTVKGRETMLMSMTGDMMLDYIDIMTNSLEAQNDDFTLKLMISDTGEAFRVIRRDGVLLVYPGDTAEACDCTMTCDHLQLLALMNGNTDVIANMTIEGDDTVPTRLVKYISPINRNFNIIEP